jgi:hypothetical protein
MDVRRSSTAWAATAAAGVVVALLLHTTADPDLWGHLAFGRQTLTSGLARTDAFSYTAPGAPVLNHEWLSDVITYALFQFAGPLGVVALRLGLLAVMLGLVVSAVRHEGGDGLTAALVAALVIVGGFPWFVTARPQLFTFACLAAFLVAVARADAGDPRPLLLTPMLTLVWVNLHGGVVAGLALLVCWAGLRLAQLGARGLGVPIPAALARGTPTPRTMALIGIVLALQVAAALVNPWGAGLWRFFAHTLAVRRVEITEWQPVALTNFGDLLGLLVLVTMALPMVVGRHPRDPVHALLLAILVTAALGARRHLALAVIGEAVLGAPYAAAVFRQRVARQPTGRLGRALPGITLALAGVLVSVGLPRAGCIVVEPGTVPRAAVEYLKAAGVEGNLAVLFDWGSYAIWHLAPRLRVSIDGRREAVYSPAQLEENAAFLYGWPGWRAGLDRDHADLALVSPRFTVYGLLVAAPDWRRAFVDETAGLFVRRGSLAEAALQRTPLPAPQPATLCLRAAG